VRRLTTPLGPKGEDVTDKQGKTLKGMEKTPTTLPLHWFEFGKDEGGNLVKQVSFVYKI